MVAKEVKKGKHQREHCEHDFKALAVTDREFIEWCGECGVLRFRNLESNRFRYRYPKK